MLMTTTVAIAMIPYSVWGFYWANVLLPVAVAGIWVANAMYVYSDGLDDSVVDDRNWLAKTLSVGGAFLMYGSMYFLMVYVIGLIAYSAMWMRGTL